MALTPPNDQALLREVDDAVRRDMIVGTWRRFGVLIVGLIVAGLVVFGGWLWWSNHSREKAGETAERLQKVTMAAQNGGKPDLKELDALTKSDAVGYRVSALLTKANLAASQGREAEAVAIYKGLAADNDLPEPYRNLALVRQTALEFDKLKPDEIINRLQPLAQPGNPWFGSAGEMTAIAHMKKRDFKVAGTLFGSIAQDKDVPRTIKSRAVQMAGLLGVDVADSGK